MRNCPDSMRPVMGCPCGRKSIGAQPSGGIGHRVGCDHVTSDRNTGTTCLSNVSGQVGAHGRGNKPRVTHPGSRTLHTESWISLQPLSRSRAPAGNTNGTGWISRVLVRLVLSDEMENIMSRAMDYLRSYITAVLLLALICLSAARLGRSWVRVRGSAIERHLSHLQPL